MSKLEKHVIKCPKGFLPKCAKIRKGKPVSKKKLLKLITSLPPSEQKRLEKVNKDLESDKVKAKERNKKVVKGEAKAKTIITKAINTQTRQPIITKAISTQTRQPIVSKSLKNQKKKIITTSKDARRKIREQAKIVAFKKVKNKKKVQLSKKLQDAVQKLGELDLTKNVVDANNKLIKDNTDQMNANKKKFKGNAFKIMQANNALNDANTKAKGENKKLKSNITRQENSLDRLQKTVVELKAQISDSEPSEVEITTPEDSDDESDGEERKTGEPGSAPKVSSVGSGESGDGGMFDSEIEEQMKNDPNFKGVISADEIKTLDVSPKMSFIMNTDPRSGPGKHWQACRIDSKFDKTVEFYDPFGDEPTPLFMKDIKHVIDKLKLPYMLKFKINMVKNQDVNSSNCGTHCIRFLKARSNGKSFKEATGFKAQDNSQEFEQGANKYKDQKGYGYI